jgi:hypothetical protein
MRNFDIVDRCLDSPGVKQSSLRFITFINADYLFFFSFWDLERFHIYAEVTTVGLKRPEDGVNKH